MFEKEADLQDVIAWKEFVPLENLKNMEKSNVKKGNTR